MKNLLFLFILSGCSVIHGSEADGLHHRVVTFKADVVHYMNNCGTLGMTAGTQALNRRSKAIVSYSAHTDKDVAIAVQSVDRMVTEKHTGKEYRQILIVD